jgi:hypothetical protein
MDDGALRSDPFAHQCGPATEPLGAMMMAATSAVAESVAF